MESELEFFPHLSIEVLGSAKHENRNRNEFTKREALGEVNRN